MMTKKYPRCPRLIAANNGKKCLANNLQTKQEYFSKQPFVEFTHIGKWAVANDDSKIEWRKGWVVAVERATMGRRVPTMHARTREREGRRENLAGAARSKGEEKSRHNDVWPPNWLPDSNRLSGRALDELNWARRMQIYAAAARTHVCIHLKGFSRGEKATHPLRHRQLNWPLWLRFMCVPFISQRLTGFAPAACAINSKCARTLFGVTVYNVKCEGPTLSGNEKLWPVLTFYAAQCTSTSRFTHLKNCCIESCNCRFKFSPWITFSKSDRSK